MKRIFAFVTMLALLLSAGAALAEQEGEGFDYTLMKRFPGYEYDAFDKEWSCYGACYKQYTDATLVLGIKASGPKEEMRELYLYCWWRDAANKNKEYDVTGIDFAIDGVIYSYEKLITNGSNSVVYLSKEAYPLINAIADCREMSVRFRTDSVRTTQNFTASECFDLKLMASAMIKYNIWDMNPLCSSKENSITYNSGSINFTNIYAYCDEYYPLTIEE